MKRRFISHNYMVQVLGLLLLWCLAIYAIYQIRSMSFQTLKIPNTELAYHHLVIHQSTEEPTVDFNSMYKSMANLPLDYWNKNKEQLNLKNSCARFPNPLAVKFHQNYWQSMHTTSNIVVHVLNAYLDTREENPDNSTVRLLAMVGSGDTVPSMYCQLWFEMETEPIIVKSYNKTKLWLGENDEALPFLINCRLPTEYSHFVPVAVSIVENPCDNAINVLNVNYNRRETKKDFGVCVKGLDIQNEDLRDKFIEWIELLNMVGAEYLFFYDLGLHSNARKILDHYENERKAQVTELKLVESSYELTKMQREVIPYTDCFYKHMYEFKYIVILDIDEVLLPLKGSTWKNLVFSNSSGMIDQTGFYNVKSLNFLDSTEDRKSPFNGIPTFMNILQNIYRKNNSTDLFSVKAFFNTEKMLTLHNDLPVSCLKDCLSYNIELDVAQLQHYHKDCSLAVKKGCVDFNNDIITDKGILSFKETLIERVLATRKYLEMSNT